MDALLREALFLLESERSHDAALRLDPELLTLYLYQMVTLLESGEYAAAEVAFGRALELHPHSGGSLRLLGECLGAQGKDAAAVAALSRAAAVEPLNPEVYRLLVYYIDLLAEASFRESTVWVMWAHWPPTAMETIGWPPCWVFSEKTTNGCRPPSTG